MASPIPRHISTTLFLAALLLWTLYTPAQAEEDSSKEAWTTLSTAEIHTLNSYIRVNPQRNDFYIDIRAMKNKKVSHTLIAAAQAINDIPITQSTMGSPIAIPIHGAWCGPGYGGPGAPIDPLDEACMRHDLCYGRLGYFSELCDQLLLDRVNTLMRTNEEVYNDPAQRNTIAGINIVFRAILTMTDSANN